MNSSDGSTSASPAAAGPASPVAVPRPPVRSARNDLPLVPGRAVISGPFGPSAGGIGRSVLRALGENAGDWRSALGLLRHSACDGCAIGSEGLAHDAHAGVHLCGRRLEGIRRDTLPPLAPADLLDASRLRPLTAADARALGRLPAPFLRRRGARGFTATTWDEALEAITEVAGPDLDGRRAGFLAAEPGLSLEAGFALGRAARRLASPHVDLWGRAARDAGLRGLKASLGVDAATCSLADVAQSELVLIVGSGLGRHHPGILDVLVAAKRRGARVVLIDSAVEVGLERARVPSDLRAALLGLRIVDDPILVSPGAHAGFLTAVLRVLLEREATAAGLIDAHTRGFDSLTAGLLERDWDALVAAAGAPRRDIEWVAEQIVRAGRVVSILADCSGPSLAPTAEMPDSTVGAPFGTSAAGAGLAALHLARGLLGRPGCGILPLVGGALAQEATACGLAPGPNGMSAEEMLSDAADGGLDSLYLANTDALDADAALVQSALSRPRLVIHQATRMTAHMAVDGPELVVLLPARTRHEQAGGGVVPTAERRLRYSPYLGEHADIRDARSPCRIPDLVVTALQGGASSDPHARGEDAGALRLALEAASPRYKGLSTLQVLGDAVQWGGPQLFRDGTFSAMPDGRARFLSADPEASR